MHHLRSSNPKHFWGRTPYKKPYPSEFLPSSMCSGRTVVYSAHCRPTVKQYSVPIVRAVNTLLTHCRQQCTLCLHCGTYGTTAACSGHCIYTVRTLAFLFTVGENSGPTVYSGSGPTVHENSGPTVCLHWDYSAN